MTLNIKHFFTSEAVSEGHPDKVCDQISDAILDAAMDFDPHAHVACETLTTTDTVVLAGEVNPVPKNVDYDKIVRDVVAKIGYNRPGEGFSDQSLKLQVLLHGQSADIARGVSEDTSLSGEQGAGDQGIMFGFACNETPAYMPAPIYYAHRIVERLAELRHTNPANYGFLRPDAKSQLTFEYEGNRPVAIRQAVVSHQHLEGTCDKVHELVPQVLREVIPAEFLNGFDFGNINKPGACLHVNPTGNFVIGGPHGDAGVTGRKIIVDTYGGAGRHGGGAFSGKDPSKVDRSASYMARYVAKNLVAAGIADRCELQVSYAIGVEHPLSFYVNFFGTGKVPEELVVKMLESEKVFNFRPKQIIEHLGLLKREGWRYQDTATGGHFGRDGFPWEKLDKVDDVKSALGLA